MRINHINYYTDEGKVYCRKVNKVVHFDGEHTRQHCNSCDMYAGSAQGEGVECEWNDMREGVQYPHSVVNPFKEYHELNGSGNKKVTLKNCIRSAREQNQDKLELWNDFCATYNVLENGVPLFETERNRVVTIPIGKDERLVLKRHPLMESLVIQEVNKVIRDYEEGGDYYDGLIYMMYQIDDGQLIPLYIGKSEKIGKGGGNLSSNIKGIEKNQNFARWGYNYAYHIGDLSAIVCSGHSVSKWTKKYEKWANALFELQSYPSDRPLLMDQTYFWMTAWSHEWTGVWKEFGGTSLTFLEYLLIGLASEVFGDVLLNDEGVNRK